MKVYKKPTTRTIVLCEEYALMDTSNTSNPSSTVDPDPGHGVDDKYAMTRRGQSIWDYWSD